MTMHTPPVSTAAPFIVDSHCHLNYPEFSDLPAVLTQAHEAGVQVLQTICTRMDEFDTLHSMAQAHLPLYCSVGMHPHHADDAPIVEVAALTARAALPKVIGIGETGLDYYYEHSDRAAQQESFRRHMLASQRTGLPVIIHSRDAEDDTLALVKEMHHDQPFPILIHCFTASQAFGEAIVAMGGYISLSGIVTFKKSDALQQAARALPLERLLIETDAPYLAPHPHRGKPNHPAYTSLVCEKLAALKGISVQACAAATTDNFFRLFTKAVRPLTV